MFGVSGWVVYGLIVGTVAKIMMPGRDPVDIIITMPLGVIGALLGGWLGQSMGLYHSGTSGGFGIAILGSIIVLVLYRVIAGRRHLGPDSGLFRNERDDPAAARHRARAIGTLEGGRTARQDQLTRPEQEGVSRSDGGAFADDH